MFGFGSVFFRGKYFVFFMFAGFDVRFLRKELNVREIRSSFMFLKFGQ